MVEFKASDLIGVMFVYVGIPLLLTLFLIALALGSRKGGKRKQIRMSNTVSLVLLGLLSITTIGLLVTVSALFPLVLSLLIVGLTPHESATRKVWLYAGYLGVVISAFKFIPTLVR